MNDKKNNLTIDWCKLFFDKQKLMTALIEHYNNGIEINYSILEDLESALSLLSIQKNAPHPEKLNDLIKQVSNLNQEKNGISLALSGLNEEIDLLKQEKLQLNNKHNELNNQQTELINQGIKAKNNQKKLKEKINSIKQDIEENSDLQKEHQKLSEELAEYKRHKERLENEIINDDLEIKELKTNEKKYNKTINKLKEETSILSKNTEELKQKEALLQSNNEEINKTNLKVQSEIDKYTKNIVNANNLKKKLYSKEEELNRDYKELSQSSQKLESQNSKQKKENKEITELIEKTKQKINVFEDAKPQFIKEKKQVLLLIDSLQREKTEFQKIEAEYLNLTKEIEELAKLKPILDEKRTKLKDEESTLTEKDKIKVTEIESLKENIESLQERVKNNRLTNKQLEQANNDLLDKNELTTDNIKKLKKELEANTKTCDSLESSQLQQEKRLDKLFITAKELRQQEKQTIADIERQKSENEQLTKENEKRSKEKASKGNKKLELEDENKKILTAIERYEQDMEIITQMTQKYDLLKIDEDKRSEQQGSLAEQIRGLEDKKSKLSKEQTGQLENINKLESHINNQGEENRLLLDKNNCLLDEKDTVDLDSNKLQQSIDNIIIEIDTKTKNHQKLVLENQKSKNALNDITNQVSELLQVHKQNKANKHAKMKLLDQIIVFMDNLNFSLLDGLIDDIEKYNVGNKSDEFLVILNNLKGCKKYADYNKDILATTKRLNNEIPKLKQNIKGKLDINVEVDRQNLTTMQHSVEEFKQQLDELNSKYNEASINDL